MLLSLSLSLSLSHTTHKRVGEKERKNKEGKKRANGRDYQLR
jgi:hypothetical protein